MMTTMTKKRWRIRIYRPRETILVPVHGIIVLIIDNLLFAMGFGVWGLRFGHDDKSQSPNPVCRKKLSIIYRQTP